MKKIVIFLALFMFSCDTNQNQNITQPNIMLLPELVEVTLRFTNICSLHGDLFLQPVGCHPPVDMFVFRIDGAFYKERIMVPKCTTFFLFDYIGYPSTRYSGNYPMGKIVDIYCPLISP
jgi:hypothetical protein